MRILLVILFLAIIGLIVWIILKTGREVNQEKIGPSEVALAADLDLDDSHRVENVFLQTWGYFDANPGTDALTEIRSIVYDRSCFITERLDESGNKAVTVTFIIDDYCQLPDYPLNADGQPEAVFERSDAHSKAEGIIKDILKISDDSMVSYQLAGSDGPDHYFDIIKKTERIR